MNGAKGSRATVGSDMGGEMTIKHAADGSLIITHKPEASLAPEVAGAPPAVAKLKTKVEPVALTAVGAAVGLGVGGPVGALLGASIGGAVDWYRSMLKKKHAATTAAAAASASAAANTLPAIRLAPLTMNTLTKAAPSFPKIGLLKIATNAKAAANPATSPSPQTTAAKNAADALYGYFQQYPYDRMLGDIFWKSPKTGTLVKAFQTAYNADNFSNQAIGQIAEDGIYGAQSAAALTLYTHDPIDPDPNA